MEYRHVKDVADHRYKAYADWDILDMEEFSQAVFLGAEQADSIQAVVDYNYDLLDAIEVFAPNQMTKERICGAFIGYGSYGLRTGYTENNQFG